MIGHFLSDHALYGIEMIRFIDYKRRRRRDSFGIRRGGEKVCLSRAFVAACKKINEVRYAPGRPGTWPRVIRVVA